MADETNLVVEVSRSGPKSISSMVKTLLEGEPSNLNYTNTIINKKASDCNIWTSKVFIQTVNRAGFKRESLTIADYILAQKIEVNLSDTYRANILTTLFTISKFHGNKFFKTMTREDLLVYLNKLRKPEVSDPLHKWIGSYNEQRQRLAKFFKWLYSPGPCLKTKLIYFILSHKPFSKCLTQLSNYFLTWLVIMSLSPCT